MDELSAFHQFYDDMIHGICIVRTDGTDAIVYANKRMLAMYDCQTEKEFLALAEGHVQGLFFEGNDQLDWKAFLTTGGNAHVTYQTLQKHVRSAECVFRPVTFGSQTYILVQMMNLQVALQERNVDDLTGFPAVSRFYQEALELARKKLEDGSFTQICPVRFNIANFRGFNREYGIDAGDRCLGYAAAQLKRVFPDGLFSRADADNFVALLPRKDLQDKIDEVCTAVNHYLGQRSFAMKAGIVVFDSDASSDVIRHSFDMAKIACDSIKNDGEHSWAVFRKEMERQLEMRRFVLDHFDQALEKGYIKVYYQPVIRTFSGRMCSAEALARWEDPQLGMISPEIFVPVLEHARRIGRLDQYMIEHTVQSLHDMLASGRAAVPVSLNLSQLDFDLIQPLKCLNEACAKYQVPHHYFHVEITERVLAENQQHMASIIRGFHEDGYEVWLDDFGSAYSSLKSLNRFSFNLIKLDMDFFRSFDARSRDIITSIVSMAKRLGIHTLAEGVETQEHLDFLKEIGCERIQGYYYSAPVPLLSLGDVLARKMVTLETGLEASVYSRAGLQDIIDNDPSALFLCENGTVRMLAGNAAFRQELKEIGISISDAQNGTLLAGNHTAKQRIMQYLKSVFSGPEEPYLFVDNGHYLRLQAEFVSGVSGFWVFRASLLNLSLEDQMAGSQQERYLMQTGPLFDGMYLMDLQKNEIRVIQCVHPRVPLGQVFPDIAESMASFSNELVHLDDQERFLKFISIAHLDAALPASPSGYIQDVFRIRREDGNYRWTMFSVVNADDPAGRNLLLCEQKVFFELEQGPQLLPLFVSSLHPAWTQDQEVLHQYIREAGLLNAFYRFGGVPLFWKDTEGRFLDVNQEMLDVLGLKQRHDVIGRTAEELGVFADPGMIREREHRVLSHGETVHFSALTVCDGISRTVPVCVFPWYSGSHIGGAAGLVLKDESENEQAFMKDAATGFLNDYGAFLTGNALDEALHSNDADYTAILLSVRDFDHLIRVFGKEFSRRVLKAIAGVIRQSSLDARAICAYLNQGRILLLGVQEIAAGLIISAQTILERIQQLNEVDGVECHFTVDLSIASGSEADSFTGLLGLLHQRCGQSMSAQLNQTEKHQGVTFPLAALDDAQERICLIDPEDNELVYLNKAMRRDLNLPADYDPAGSRCYEILQGRNTPCEHCMLNTLAENTMTSRRIFFRNASEAYNTRDLLVQWKGRSLRMSICFPDDDGRSAQVSRMLHDEIWASEAIASGMGEKNTSAGIQKTVDEIGKNLQAEHLLVFEERADGTVCCTYEWCAADSPALKNELQSVLMSRLVPLYRMLETNKVVMIADYPSFSQEHPDFWLPGYEIRNVISGHLVNAGGSVGFTLVLNAYEENFHQAGYILSTLTDFLSVMIQNRNNISEALSHSLRDPMTGVLNRAGLTKYLSARKRQETAAFVSGDINGLKEENDRHGHLSGDHLIRGISDILVSFADKDHVVRMGGDEFLMIKEGMDDAGARDLIQKIKNTCQTEGYSIALGYTIHSGSISNMDDIVRKADRAMYEDKGHYYHRRRSDSPFDRRKHE